MIPTYHELKSAKDKRAFAEAPSSDPVPEGVPTSGGTGPTAWVALGSNTKSQIIHLVCKDGQELEDQANLQIARLNGLPLPAGAEILQIDRTSCSLLVLGNADSAASDLRDAGFPNAVASHTKMWVRLRYEDEDRALSMNDWKWKKWSKNHE